MVGAADSTQVSHIDSTGRGRSEPEGIDIGGDTEGCTTDGSHKELNTRVSVYLNP
jgi:hypothetical protein